MAHLQRLLSEHLARVSLEAPAVTLRLCTQETAPLAGATTSLLPDELCPGDSWQQMLERLVARLGPQNVLQTQACADHRPEQMQQWRSAVPQATAAATKPVGINRMDVLYPSWLLETPLKLALRGNCPLYQGPLSLLAGPQRLEAGWWDAAQGAGLALRDYFIARSEQAGLLWIYRERPLAERQPQDEVNWYLHGLFA
jgi:protein ImuB